MAPRIADGQIVTVIPFAGSDDDEPTFPAGDSGTIAILQWNAYTDAWMRCLKRVKHIIEDLYAPTVSSIVQEVRGAYSQVLPGLPYPELPVVAVSGAYSNPDFLSNIMSQLRASNEVEDSPDCLLVSLRPAECTNISNTMSSLISGFLSQIPESKNGRVKKEDVDNLANNDINLLKEYYVKVYDDSDSRILVVVLHEFEQYESNIIQDLLYICSLQVPSLPLVFILPMASPSSPLSFIQAAYPGSTMELLQFASFSCPQGPEIIETLIADTFLSLDYKPEIMLAHSALAAILNYSRRYNASLNAAITLIQLAFLKHFTSSPLSVLAKQPIALNELGTSSCFHLWDQVILRLYGQDGAADLSIPSEFDALVASVKTLRETFNKSLQGRRFSFRILYSLCNSLPKRHLRNIGAERGLVSKLSFAALEGHLEDIVQTLGDIISNLDFDDLHAMLDALEHLVDAELPSNLDTKTITLLIADCSKFEDDIFVKQSRKRIRQWLMEFSKKQQSSTPLEDNPLSDAWYSGSTPLPLELLNPATRASLLTALQRPHDFTSETQASDEDNYPDTTLLFQRYLESGKLINVYDWFESFKFALESQSEKRSPTKKSRKGKKKKVDEVEAVEVQARFMRALHELDYMGFLKPGGRKADHVTRTIFDEPDD